VINCGWCRSISFLVSGGGFCWLPPDSIEKKVPRLTDLTVAEQTFLYAHIVTDVNFRL
jgi:hypothetical protein